MYKQVSEYLLKGSSLWVTAEPIRERVGNWYILNTEKCRADMATISTPCFQYSTPNWQN